MRALSRREFVGASLATAAAALFPVPLSAQTRCVSGPLPAFVPNALTVDCASRANFKLFRQNSEYLGLAGVVTMSYVRGKFGEYQAGNLFLFPWLKPKGQALGANKVWGSVMPLDAARTMAKAPIPNWRLPLDEYFLRFVLEAPPASFIGVRIDVPFGLNDSRRPWFTNIPKLFESDDKGAGIAWTSSNLNHPWFGGSRWIPNTDTCSGNAWRKLIVEGVARAATDAC
jgi:hypothetical protein